MSLSKKGKNKLGLMLTTLINNVLYMFLNTFLIAYFFTLTNYNYKIISIYYIYSKQTSEYFFYEELYVYIDCASRFRSSLIQSFKQHEEEIMNVLKKELNKEAVIKIMDVHSLENRRFLVCLYYVLPILFIIICCVSFYAIFSYRRKEAQDNMYLFSYDCLLEKNLSCVLL